MKLKGIDFAIILGYLITTVFIGLYLRKKAARNKSSYLLGGRQLPWYMLSLSNASGMLDISGTMWLVTLLFVYGLKSIWIPWLWPVFNQIFLMVYLSAWLRRSGATTGAEWMNTRFGEGKGAVAARNIIVVFAVISCLGFMAYGFIGLGKFVEIFVPWEIISPYLPIHIRPEYVPHLYGIFFIAFAVFYSLLGGMSGLVWADVVQFTIITASSLMIALLAMRALSLHPLHVPDGWYSPFFGKRLDLDWRGILPEVNRKIASDGFSFFSLFFGMMLLKGILVSAAGPAPNYDMQKILATRNPREASLMSGFVSLILNPVQYFLVAGLAILGLIYYPHLHLVVAGHPDLENILPSVINEIIPAGLAGLLLAGLLAAFNSTFAGTLNAGQAYLINDVVLKYVRPKARGWELRIWSYTTGLVLILVSVILGFLFRNINSILQWLVSGLWGGYTAANILKWYWWRFNAQGYFWGMVAGITVALIAPYALPSLMPGVPKDIVLLYFFPVLLLISLIASIAGTYAYPPVEEKVLKEFYTRVRPWGFWNPVHAKVAAEDPSVRKNRDFLRDMFNVSVGIMVQTALIAFPIVLVLKQWHWSLFCLIFIVAGVIILKKTWYNKLNNYI